MAPKIVSFDRSPAFVYSRAMLNRRKNRGIDALELLRGAVEREPGNKEYCLDLAEMYSAMGMFEKSNRILLDMISAGDAPAECWLGLAMNSRDVGNEDAVGRAMAAFRKRVSEDDFDLAKDLSGLSEPFVQDARENRQYTRKQLRGIHTAARAGDLMLEDIDRACALFERGIAQGADMPEVQAMYALALADRGDEEEAICLALEILDDPLSDVHELSIAAQTLLICGQWEDARAAVDKVLELHPGAMELNLMICVMSEMKLYSEIAEMIRLALQESPYDRRLLHQRAMALHLAGARDAECAAIWRKLIRLDPNDVDAEYWLKEAEEGRLSESVTSINQMLPDEKIGGILHRFNTILLKGEAVDPDDYPGLRREIEWALSWGVRESQIAASMILAMSDDEESRSVLREAMYREYMHPDARRCVLETLKLLGKNSDDYFPPEEVMPREYYLPMRQQLRNMPAHERQMIRFAESVLYENYGISVGAELADMWNYYKANTVHDKLVCTQEAAAALAWNLLILRGERPDIKTLAEHFECGQRRMVYYARHLAGVIEGAALSDENHRS